MKKMIMSLFALCLAVGLLGCETTKGFGKDLQKAGASIEESASS